MSLPLDRLTIKARDAVMRAQQSAQNRRHQFLSPLHLLASLLDERGGVVGSLFDRIGVDGIAVITPFFIACTQDGLERHFTTVADAVETPIYLYDIPARTQNHIEPETARLLAGHGNIAGIKDSGGAQDTLEAYMEVGRAVDGFDVYSGPDQLVHWALTNGAKGCISGLGNVMPDVLARIVSCVNAGDKAGAAKAQETYAAFRTDLYKLGYPPALVKRALYLRDPSVGLSRQPALLPDPEQDRAIAAILSRYGL